MLNKNKKQRICVLLLFVFSWMAPGLALAKIENALGYIVSFPTGESDDFIPRTSFAGIGYEATWREETPWGLGFSARWQHWDHDAGIKTDVTPGGVTVTGDQERAIDAFPVLVHGRFYAQTMRDFTPFVGFGLGTIYSDRYLRVGPFNLDRNGWQFAIAPELGVTYFRADSTFGGIFSVRYDTGFKSGDLTQFTNLNIQLGAISRF